MENRIREVRFSNRRLDPAQAEIWITVYPERLTATTQVRGRLMGPRCSYATTVEVAYPLRELRRDAAAPDSPYLTLRVIIPEASLWEPESPFLYEGPLELWQDGQLCDQVQVSHGLRLFTLGLRGLRINGRLLRIRGKTCMHCLEQDAPRLRQQGYNTLLVPVAANTPDLCSLANRLGFLVLGRLTCTADLLQATALSKHPSCLGWVLASELLPGALVPAFLPSPSVEGQLLGMELKQPLSGNLPDRVSFLACEKEMLPALEQSPLPKILLTHEGRSSDATAAGTDPTGILGWIETA